VIITFLVYDATYKYKLYLNNTNTLLFNNTEVGKVINLGKFAVGTELVFKLNVTTTGYSYYTGSASRNPDKIVHALVSKTSPTVWQFGFEDMYNGGDKDYNDCIFKLEGGVSTGKSAVARDSVADGSGKLTVLVKNGKALVKVVDMPMQYASYVAGSKDVQLNVGGNMIDFNNAKIVKLGKKRNAWKYVASVGTLIIDADKGLWKLDAVVENLTINNHVVEAMLFCEGNVVADNSSVVSEKDNGIVALLKSFAE
jgi:hypothetical protein